MMLMRIQMEKWALITGATAGIGYELAKLFARDKWNLVLVARNKTRMEKAASDFKGEHGISSMVVAEDLSDRGTASRIFSQTQEKFVSVLVNNAGFGAQELFAKGDLRNWLAMMHVNMDALVELTHLYLQPMRERR